MILIVIISLLWFHNLEYLIGGNLFWMKSGRLSFSDSLSIGKIVSALISYGIFRFLATTQYTTNSVYQILGTILMIVPILSAVYVEYKVMTTEYDEEEGEEDDI